MANEILSKVIDFIKMEKKHKEDLFNIKKEFKTKKIDLKKNHCAQKADLCIAELEEIQKNGFNPEIIKSNLKKKVALHEKQLQECEDLCKQKDQKIKEWREKNTQERENFKKGL